MQARAEREVADERTSEALAQVEAVMAQVAMISEQAEARQADVYKPLAVQAHV